MPSDHSDQLALHIAVAVDVPLSCLDRPVTGKQLDMHNEPPARWASRATRVMNVRRPEWDEQPWRPMLRNTRLNQTTILSSGKNQEIVDVTNREYFCLFASHSKS
jgi:hypothetical protein